MFNICLIGISGSGKSTLAYELAKKIKARTQAQVIDGDDLRQRTGNLFGYTHDERMKNSRVVRTVISYLNENNISTIVAIVAPYREMREELRKSIGNSYIEIYVKCSYAECLRRDVKGHYKRNKEGLLKNLNGADDIFEEPVNSEIVINTEKESIEQSIEKIIYFLKENNYGDF